jgi:hypothetical protein
MDRISDLTSGNKKRPMTATLRSKDYSSFNHFKAERELKVFRTKIMKQF